MVDSGILASSLSLLKRAADEVDATDPDAPADPGQQEIFSSWALFILIFLLIITLFTSYYLQLKKIQAVHETVISIFFGMFVGLVIRLTPGQSIQHLVSFKNTYFFNILLPPIILNSGYELHQANFFRNMGSILTFAFAGTFISAVVIGVVLYLWTIISLHMENINISFVQAISVGATLSATDPVTILAIFNTYKVDPKLYTIIFGESILNDAVAIVMFETAQRFHGTVVHPFSFVKGVGIFLFVFFVSLLIGVVVGMTTALVLKHTYLRRYPQIETCIILLVAYASYLFPNAIHVSGIVSLLFCGITLKHYAYYNMSRRTQLATKYLFQALAQLSENFIFIYLGLNFFTQEDLVFKPGFILVTALGVCIARWAAVFPLSKLVNWVIRKRAQTRGLQQPAEEIPHSYQAMLFWAGLRGAVGVALAAGMAGENQHALQATVLVVVVLTVIVFGGTTARMLEILGIRTGVVEEIDSDDEFDIENSSNYYKRQGNGFNGSSALPLSSIENGGSGTRGDRRAFSSGGSPHRSHRGMPARRSSRGAPSSSQQELLRTPSIEDSDYDSDASDLPPAARKHASSSRQPREETSGAGPSSAAAGAAGAAEPPRDPSPSAPTINPIGALKELVRGTVEDQAEWFRQLDEGYIKPHLLLDPSKGGGPSGSGGRDSPA